MITSWKLWELFDNPFSANLNIPQNRCLTDSWTARRICIEVGIEEYFVAEVPGGFELGLNQYETSEDEAKSALENAVENWLPLRLARNQSLEIPGDNAGPR